MKPVPIADYLDHIGRGSGEKPSPRRETSLFRPRSLQSPQSLELRSLPAFDGAERAVAPVKPDAQERTQRSLWERYSAPFDAKGRSSLAEREAAKVAETGARIDEARAQGRAEGIAEGRAEAEERFAAERVALREQAATERLDFQLNEYAGLESALRARFAEAQAYVGDAVARILVPFLTKEVARYAADELARAVGRLAAGGAPGLITIRGPERLLSRLRERIADLPAEVQYIEDGGVEAAVECGATRIVTELKPWQDLLASLDA